MEFLGIICDTDKLVLEIPDDKLKDIHRILLCWINKEFAKLKEIQSLVGKLNFIASCVKPGRIYMSRLLNWLRDVYGQSSNISVPTLVQKDIKWWLLNWLRDVYGQSSNISVPTLIQKDIKW
jgi:hypothetical protein